MKSALMRKPPHPRSCSIAIRRFIIHLAIDVSVNNAKFLRLALIQRLPLIARVRRAKSRPEQADSFFG
jgi:hypothetical protein